MRTRGSLLAFLGLALVGCGGDLGDQCANDNVECRAIYGVSPDAATIAPGGTVTLNAFATRGKNDAIAFAVDGGDPNGTLDVSDATADESHAIYTAPAIAGTYRISARFTKGTKVVSTQTATLTVTP